MIPDSLFLEWEHSNVKHCHSGKCLAIFPFFRAFLNPSACFAGNHNESDNIGFQLQNILVHIGTIYMLGLCRGLYLPLQEL